MPSESQPAADDNVASHFAPLFEFLETVVTTRDYANAAVAEYVDSGVRRARSAGVRPEAAIAFLRERVHEAPLTAVGDWYRSVLAERIVARAIATYFGDVAAADGGDHKPAPIEASLVEASAPPRQTFAAALDRLRTLLASHAGSPQQLPWSVELEDAARAAGQAAQHEGVPVSDASEVAERMVATALAGAPNAAAVGRAIARRVARGYHAVTGAPAAPPNVRSATGA
jgi:hypothetical protein